jgi:hypothetical protein
VDVPTFIAKWKQSGASERANKDSFLRDLCDVLGVEHPGAKTGDPERDRYVFEREAILVHGGERHSVGFIDLYKKDAFILEAKQGSDAESKKIGTARRGTPAWNVAMQEAFGQALNYASTIEPPPPFLIVTDIGYCFDLYAAFDGTRNYRKFPDALRGRIHIDWLERDPAHLDTLRAVFTDPHSLDPAKRTVRVTREIAGHLANVAKSLDDEGHEPELVAKFLMRCLFTMFAEDIELLPKGIFTRALQDRWIEHPEVFPGEVEELWRKMNDGGFLFGAGNIWRFNGGLFAEPVALPLTRQQLIVLGLASASNWADVEPAIFGTLLERALDPKERHRLGAHFTPRAYVERLVKPTIEEPLRAEWDNVRAQVVKLVAAEDPEKNKKAVAEARKIVEAFYEKLTKTRVLDPACGSGNFLYVALDLFKRIENEVIEQLESLGYDRLTKFGRMVSPQQFLGIEIKPWAKEIAELVLWIGWLQWQVRTRGYRTHPEEPILRDYHNIECRDAVLAYDEKVPLLDDDGNPVTRWDGETTKKHPVTGEDVPDETARVPVFRYVNPRKAEWPEAEFVVGNPPFIGNKRMREALGDGYAEALREAHRDVPESADYVMYWWNHAATLLRTSVIRFGLITTNSISQTFNRRVVRQHLENDDPISLVFAIPDHPWVDASDGAAVRVAMTASVVGSALGEARTVVSEASMADHVVVETLSRRGRINPSLTIGLDVASCTPLQANDRLSSPGVKLHGSGFIVPPEDAESATFREAYRRGIVRDYRNGKDILDRPRRVKVIDLFSIPLDELRSDFAAVYQWVHDRVRPERQENARSVYREKWWIFGEPRALMRPALQSLRRFIATPVTSKHRIFAFLQDSVLPDDSLIAIALEDAYALGVLSSIAHILWARTSGSTLEDRPRYIKTRCFDPFPFPDPDEFTRQRIRNLGEQLDAHRKRQQELHPELTITGMYNVLEKLRSGEALTAKEKKIHEQGLVSVLKQIHEDLDAAVFDAYGWPHALSDEEILERLVALNAERAEEERRGLIRWLRPEFQNPSGAVVPSQREIESEEAPAAIASKTKDLPRWPKELREQVSAVRDLFSAGGRDAKSWTAEEVARAFKGSRRSDVAAVLDALSSLGILLAFETPKGRHWRAA